MKVESFKRLTFCKFIHKSKIKVPTVTLKLYRKAFFLECKHSIPASKLLFFCCKSNYTSIATKQSNYKQ